MRIHKRQHGLLHLGAFLLTGGLSGPASVVMMSSKAARNREADAEMEQLIEAVSGNRPPVPARKAVPAVPKAQREPLAPRTRTAQRAHVITMTVFVVTITVLIVIGAAFHAF